MVSASSRSAIRRSTPRSAGGNYPRPSDSDKRTVDTERTNHGGGDAFQYLDADPNWRRIFAGYAFGVDYRVERGHAYMLQDQKETERVTNFNQPPGNRRRRPPGATRADARVFCVPDRPAGRRSRRVRRAVLLRVVVLAKS